MNSFEPCLSILPEAQLRLWPELDSTPEPFTLYGGTALALRLGHRVSVDFDFFTVNPLDPEDLLQTIPYLHDAEVVRVAPHTLTCRVDRSGPVLISFYGGLRLSQAAPRERIQGRALYAASLLDIAGTKVSVIQKRAEVKDYLDIDALLQNGITLAAALRAGLLIHGGQFNPLATLKALCYFEDIPELATDVRVRLLDAVKAVDMASLTQEGLS